MKYNEYPDIEVPAFLSGSEWNDSSWHNDAMPHSTLFLTADESGEGPCVEVWANYPDVKDRQYLGDSYIVVYQKTYAIETGSDVTLYMGDGERVARGFARGAEVAKTIIADIVAQHLIAPTFSELHDVCDANVLGIQEQILMDAENEIAALTGVPAGNDETDIAALAVVQDILNHAQAITDLWLRNRKEN